MTFSGAVGAVRAVNASADSTFATYSLGMFRPGANIAMKVPLHQVASTIHFYGAVLGFERTTPPDSPTVAFQFGDKVLWIDGVSTASQAELWLEIETDDLDAASAHFEEHGVTRCDDIESLGEFPGFWISAPSQIIHLVTSEDSEGVDSDFVERAERLLDRDKELIERLGTR